MNLTRQSEWHKYIHKWLSYANGNIITNARAKAGAGMGVGAWAGMDTRTGPRAEAVTGGDARA